MRILSFPEWRSFPRREESEKFHVMVRERVYYEKDRTWMGAERKRGALIELNRAIIEGRLPRVNYVLTVDADTCLLYTSPSPRD